MFFLVHEGISGTTIGLPAKRHLNGISLACRLWPSMEYWIGSFVTFQRIRTSIVRKPYTFVIFGGCPDPLPLLWISACHFITFVPVWLYQFSQYLAKVKFAYADNEGSNQSTYLKFPPEETLDPWLPIEHQSKTQISLHRCAGWSEPAIGIHANLYIVLATGSF